jgi:hypothetical protein
MRVAIGPLALAAALSAWVADATAAAQTRPPDACVAYVHVAGDGPSSLPDYGHGLALVHPVLLDEWDAQA